MLKIKQWVIACILVAFSYCLGDSQEQQEMVVRYIEKAPLIDGDLSDPCWQAVEPVSDFFIYRGGGDTTDAVKMRLARDNEWLYLALEIELPNMEALEVIELTPASPIHNHDSVEILIDPGADEGQYIHYKLGISNVRWESLRKRRGTAAPDMDVTWSVPWRSATKITETGWQAEAAFPLSAIAEHGGLDKLTMNVGVNRIITTLNESGMVAHSRREVSSWVPVERGFHEPAGFAVLKGFEGLEPAAPLLVSARGIRTSLYRTDESGAFSYNILGSIKHYSSTPGTVRVTVEDIPGTAPGESVFQDIQVDGDMEFAVKVPVKEFSGRTARLALSDPETGEILQSLHLRDLITDELSLPDPLTTIAGDRITTATEWKSKRRPEILELFRENVYGRTPIGRPDNLSFEIVETDPGAMGGMATLKRVAIRFEGHGGQGVINLSAFIPNNSPGPAPAFLLICNRSREHIDHTREVKKPFWPAERIVERGYIAAAFHNSDVGPDRKADGLESGVFAVFGSKDSERPPNAWGTIAAWAWGASRVMDYFETDEDIDEKRIAVAGHSRGGKAALWCGAEDERFALIISNNSGCTGAALSRRKRGETVARINKNFPHWFCKNYKSFNNREDALPVDQHQLIALQAPRLVYVASASADAWADPKGEFLSCFHAGPVYRLFGLPDMGADTFPDVNQPLHTGYIGYHLREGKHDLTEYDWNVFMDFADKHWKKDR